MKLLFGAFVIIQLISVCVSLPPKEVHGIRVYGRGSLSRQGANSTAITCAGTVGPLCASDCQTLMTCVGKPNSVANVTCPNYCSGNACTTTLLSTSPCQVSNNFLCTSEGTFPNPSSCNSYYYCSANGATATMYMCPTGYQFNLPTQMCTWGASCQTLNCVGYQNQWIQYNYLNKGYYAFCGAPPIMFKCPDAADYIFDTTINQCKYNCPYTGYFTDPYNCTQFMSCQWTNGGINAVPISCPPEYYYNGSLCVPGTCISEITTTPATSTVSGATSSETSSSTDAPTGNSSGTTVSSTTVSTTVSSTTVSTPVTPAA